MATITPTQVAVPTGSNDGVKDVIVTVWANILAADTCTAVQIPGYTDQTVHVTGTLDGATLVLQGSNNNSNFFTLHATDATSAAISITVTNNGYGVLENPLWIRPSTSGGGGSSTATVTLVSRR